MKDRYSEHFMIGAAVNTGHIMGTDAEGQALVAAQFNTLTAENDMKWEQIQPEPGQFDFRSADALVAFSEENGIFVVGHTLLWHQQTPAWVFEDENGKPASRELLLSRLKHHIETVVGRYKGRVQGWDVVNEAFEEDGSWRKSKWFEIIGPDYIEQAFRYAAAADPEAELYYNDYNMFKAAKRSGVMSMVKALLEKGVRIDGVGFQGHYGLGGPDLGNLEASILAVKETGLQVMFTELDISVLPFPDQEKMGADISLDFELQEEFNPYAAGLPAEVGKELADGYSRLFELFLRHSETISRVTFWGVEDGSSWRNSWPMAGRTDYPLLFDRNYQPKQAFHALVELVK
ncbi:endo-1,4-beta-xylanase [Pelagicoccus sp. SDUM812005]|uniref:endo-1,4-beta-xylanase n=1 Tax=Pelagicoccus sp. SDUM812005 TaxID=3041257 RepID=UPI00280F7B2B|nr:endo-1,4-beta-xylanase [Pelagicoccus sp. SDUM812005]MDQ8183355.1 endo-1,4-beta-xylanase [Pelagicoccus sp. SDUM812005]